MPVVSQTKVFLFENLQIVFEGSEHGGFSDSLENKKKLLISFYQEMLPSKVQANGCQKQFSLGLVHFLRRGNFLFKFAFFLLNISNEAVSLPDGVTGPRC